MTSLSSAAVATPTSPTARLTSCWRRRTHGGVRADSPSARAPKPNRNSAAVRPPAPDHSVARVLIIGCGCRGLALAQGLRERGHAVRGTTRDSARLDVLEAAGVDAVLADPDRIMTIVPTFEHVTVACILLGSAVG